MSSQTTRCLYGGYRYETPLAGWWVEVSQNAYGTRNRQKGENFTGLYYTLHRHYDPFLMRFTSPDPLAAPFYNLFHYSGNSPARFFDPDGLQGIEFTFEGYWGRVKNIFTKGEFEFKLSTDGYTDRAAPTLDGARVQAAQLFSGGSYYSDAELAAKAQHWADRGMGGYFNAGGVVAGATIVAAATIATGGAASGAFAAVGGAAYVGSAAVAGNAIAWGIGSWAGAEMATRAATGRGQTLGESAVSFGTGAAFPVAGAIGSRIGAASVGMGGRTLGRMSVPAPQPRTWNEFQRATGGQFSSRAEAGKAWAVYKEANGITTGAPRSAAARVGYLKSLVKDYSTPSWMKQWLAKGQVPPGYEVHHIRPLSIGGPDVAANMRLQAIDLHRTHHRFYRPWE